MTSPRCAQVCGRGIFLAATANWALTGLHGAGGVCRGVGRMCIRERKGDSRIMEGERDGGKGREEWQRAKRNGTDSRSSELTSLTQSTPPFSHTPFFISLLLPFFTPSPLFLRHSLPSQSPRLAGNLREIYQSLQKFRVFQILSRFEIPEHPTFT